MQTLNKNEGLITQIIGPVIDVEFQQGELPEIYNALNISASYCPTEHDCGSLLNWIKRGTPVV